MKEEGALNTLWRNAQITFLNLTKMKQHFGLTIKKFKKKTIPFFFVIFVKHSGCIDNKKILR